jgi:hypothetical protein
VIPASAACPCGWRTPEYASALKPPTGGSGGACGRFEGLTRRDDTLIDRAMVLTRFTLQLSPTNVGALSDECARLTTPASTEPAVRSLPAPPEPSERPGILRDPQRASEIPSEARTPSTRAERGTTFGGERNHDRPGEPWAMPSLSRRSGALAPRADHDEHPPPPSGPRRRAAPSGFGPADGCSVVAEDAGGASETPGFTLGDGSSALCCYRLAGAVSP